jgi:hypothetical protein
MKPDRWRRAAAVAAGSVVGAAAVEEDAEDVAEAAVAAADARIRAGNHNSQLPTPSSQFQIPTIVRSRWDFFCA